MLIEYWVNEQDTDLMNQRYLTLFSFGVGIIGTHEVLDGLGLCVCVHEMIKRNDKKRN